MSGLKTLAILCVLPAAAFAHGDVTPQAVDTSALPALGEEWREENPWRDPNSAEYLPCRRW